MRRLRSRSRGSSTQSASSSTLPGNIVINGFSTTSYYATANGLGVRGDGAGFYVLMVAIPRSPSNAQFWSSCTNTSSTGWQLRQINATDVVFRCFNGAGSVVASPAYTLVPNVITAIMGVHTGTALRLYANRAQVGTENAIVGYSVPAAGLEHNIGRAVSSVAFAADWIYLIGGAGVPSLANFQSWCDSFKVGLGRSGTDMPSVPGEHKWGPFPFPVSATGTVTDDIGSDDAGKVGTGVAQAHVKTVFGW